MADDEDYRDFLPFAEQLADSARAETLPRLEGGGVAADKNEGGAFDPVTEADRAAERAMRALIVARFPDHGISGEEYGETPAAAQGQWSWSLDPIDGTRAFICGMPGWTVLIALLRDGEPVLGVIDAPRLDERYVGFGARAEMVSKGARSPLQVSGCERLAEARLSTTDPFLFADGEAEGFGRVRRAARLTRYGFDAYAYARLAAGWIDLVVESGLKPHDYNALAPVVRAAGGVIGSWEGDGGLAGGRIVAAASQPLFDEAVRLLRG